MICLLIILYLTIQLLTKLSVLDFVSKVHDAILMNVYLDVRNPGGSGFWNEGIWARGGK